MRGLEPEALVEAVRVLAGIVGRQLHAAAPAPAGLVDRPAHHFGAKSAAAKRRVDADRLDLRHQRPLPHQMPDEREHESPDDSPILFGDICAVSLRPLHLFEGLAVAAGVRLHLFGRSRTVVEQHPQDLGQVLHPRAPDLHGA